jgi:hypothetical protein
VRDTQRAMSEKNVELVRGAKIVRTEYFNDQRSVLEAIGLAA